MMKTNLSLILVMMMTLSGVGITSAQTAPKSSPQSTPNGEPSFVAEPITLETPTAALYGTFGTPAVASATAKLLLIDGMNHVLKTVPNEQAKQVSSYSDPSFPVAPDRVGAISSFVKQAALGAGLNTVSDQTATVAASPEATGGGSSRPSPTKKVR